MKIGARLGGLGRRVGEEREINIAPLIDMVFILLIFFMVTTTFTKDLQIDWEAPEAQSASPAPPQAIRVTLNRGGRVSIDGQAVNPWVLQSRLRARLADSPSGDVLVVADPGGHSGDLVRTVDACRLAGASQVAVAVNEP